MTREYFSTVGPSAPAIVETCRLTMCSINEIGHLTGKQTIAERAENAVIIEVLRGLGVDDAQGYGVSQPQRVQRAAIA